MEQFFTILENHKDTAISVAVFIVVLVVIILEGRIKLIDYYAARAPEVPDWFEPKNIPRKPIHPGYTDNIFGKHSNHPLSQIYVSHYHDGEWSKHENGGDDEFLVGGGWKSIPENDYSIVPKELKESVRRHEELIDEFIKSDIAWKAFKQEQTIVQWRKHYAKLMISR